MKRIGWFHLGMIMIVLIGTLASFGTALAEMPPADLFIKKTVTTSVNAGWEWTIEKSADVETLLLSPGQVGNIDYTVALSATEVTAAWHIAGDVDVRNSTSGPATIESITDQLNDGTSIQLACSKTFPFVLQAGSTVHCTYAMDLPNGDASANTVTVVSSIGTFIQEVPVTWGDPVDVIDECVDVFDSNIPDGLGQVCAGDADKTFTYSLEVGPYEECGLYEINNTAFFMAQDSGAYGEASEVVLVDVPCEGSCTLTPGYWKTHSSYGPAPYDDTWMQIGEDTAFFYSGKSYYQVLWTSPSGGNAYYILAHAYIAAKLNQLNDADFTAAQAAFDAATALFSNPTNTPAYVGGLKGSARNEWINLASTLDNYNNGFIGPGHCSE